MPRVPPPQCFPCAISAPFLLSSSSALTDCTPRQGLEAKETPRSLAFCGHVVYNEEALVVLDATKDERFWKNDLVTGPPNIRFYAGCPLIVEGHVLGTICILHTAPLPDFPEDKLAVLRRFAHLVKMAIEQHKAQSIAEVKALGLRGLIEESTAPIFGLDKDGKCNELNAMAEQALEVRAGEVLGKDFSDELVAEDSKAYFQDTIQKLTDKPILEESLCFSFKSGKTGEPIDFVFSCAPRYDAMGRLAGHLLLGQNSELPCHAPCLAPIDAIDLTCYDVSLCSGKTRRTPTAGAEDSAGQGSCVCCEPQNGWGLTERQCTSRCAKATPNPQLAGGSELYCPARVLATVLLPPHRRHTACDSV